MGSRVVYSDIPATGGIKPLFPHMGNLWRIDRGVSAFAAGFHVPRLLPPELLRLLSDVVPGLNRTGEGERLGLKLAGYALDLFVGHAGELARFRARIGPHGAQGAGVIQALT